MAVINGSKLANEAWLLDKEEVTGYAVSGNLDVILGENTLKHIGKQGLAFATSGDLSLPSKENAIEIMRCWCSVSFNKYLIAFNLKHIEGNIFINAMLSPLVDIVGHFL
jgi:hypothetical protein